MAKDEMIRISDEERAKCSNIEMRLVNKIGNDWDRVRALYPVAPDDGCPTCDGRGFYRLDDKTYECDCKHQRILQMHYFNANIPREYHPLGLEHFTSTDRSSVVPVVEKYIAEFVDNFHFGIGLTFTGPFGTGKTMAQAIILKELVKDGRNVYFITFEELINAWGASWKDDAAKRILDVKLKGSDCLGIDEWRSDPRNERGFLANGLDSVVRHRTGNLLPTLVTTNMTQGEEKGEFARVYSLLSARNIRVDTKGEDARSARVRIETTQMKKMGERRPIL